MTSLASPANAAPRDRTTSVTALALLSLGLLVWFFEPLGALMQVFVERHGSATAALELLLVPVGATLIVVLRTIVGIEGFGIFSPLILAYAFVRLGTVVGLLTFTALLLAVTPARLLMDRFALLSVARTGILVAACAVVLFALSAFAPAHLELSSLGLPVVIMAGIIDRFVTAQMDQSTGEAVKLSLFTVLAAAILATFLQWGALRSAVFATPDLALLSFPVCLLVGRYTGLRVSEYYRFRSVADVGSVGAGTVGAGKKGASGAER